MLAPASLVVFVWCSLASGVNSRGALGCSQLDLARNLIRYVVRRALTPKRTQISDLVSKEPHTQRLGVGFWVGVWVGMP